MHAVKGLLVTGIVLIAATADAQPTREDVRRVMGEMSRDLGVTAQQLVGCFRNARDTLQAAEPGPERDEARNAVLLPCLQKTNPAITDDSLDAVMGKYRPQSRAAGR
jgi:hypothetical protein